jgi:tetratricopeptide (TPR) repeat protein
VARAYDKAGVADSAIKYYETALASTTSDRVNIDVYRAPMERRLGALYEEKQQRSKAAQHYQSFIDLWKDAEPPFQSQVAEIRKRLSRLFDAEHP